MAFIFLLIISTIFLISINGFSNSIFKYKTFSRQSIANNNKQINNNQRTMSIKMATDSIISPFDSTSGKSTSESGTVNYADDDDEELTLTRENVERVLDEMRPYLKADG